VPAKGYYDWKEDDGSINEKYMYIAIVNATTADGVQFSVAATTYIDEFTGPIKETEQKIQSSINQTAARILEANQQTRETIAQRTEGMNTQNTIFIITGLTILIVVLVSFMFARALTRPITKLKEVAEKVSNGDFNVRMPDVKSRDEILDLTAAMELLVTGFKHLKTQVAQLTAQPAGGQPQRPPGKPAAGQPPQGPSGQGAQEGQK
ncbi:MAG: HAMP domain-containing protein, partial [Nanobdellota archaeon]